MAAGNGKRPGTPQVNVETLKAPDAVTDSPAAVMEAPADQLEGLVELLAHGGDGGDQQPEPGEIGRTMFDSPTSEDGTVTVLLPRAKLEQVTSQSFVRIHSGDGRRYLGAVVAGPFAEPDGLRADSPIIVTTSVRGGTFLFPRFHGRCQVELLGEQLADGSVVPPQRRPRPSSPVFLLSVEEMAELLKISGKVRIGVADIHPELVVTLPADRKSVLPRHLGILGTTGGGKSTTVSGLIAQLQKQGVACILLDTEGEYTEINRPTEDRVMDAALTRQGRIAEGIDSTTLFHLVNRDTRNPRHPSRRQFTLRFDQISPYAMMGILELTEPQERRFLQAYDVASRLLYEVKQKNNASLRDSIWERDEFETGYPDLTLDHLYDVTRAFAEWVGDQPRSEFISPDFKGHKADLDKLMHTGGTKKGGGDEPAKTKGENPASWRVIMGKLGRLRRLKVFDQPKAPSLPFDAMIAPGAVSIIDLSDTDSTQVNNLAITELLRGILDHQDAAVTRAAAELRDATPVMIFIEEAHEFLSAKRIDKMQELFEQVARIARRGRKRWLGLVFITQLPQHLPDEVLGLINNWILHKISDQTTVGRLKRAIGGIDNALWLRLPSLAPGQAVVSLTHLSRPLLTTIDPTPCKLLMVE